MEEISEYSGKIPQDMSISELHEARDVFRRCGFLTIAQRFHEEIEIRMSTFYRPLQTN